MKKIICFSIFYLLFISCQSQKTNVNSAKNIESSSDDKNYFLGNWKLIERNYRDENNKKAYPLHECEKKYSLTFEKENTAVFLTKNYVAGKNCEIKSNSGKIIITINEGSFSYLDLDLKVNERYKIISKSKFSITYNEILEGKVREIEDVYVRL
ncbi:lipocalin family protein [Chryseobacterium gwangjuense]|uniref:lipocalin family protein n=1 Tax=Chryseobacterium gwangjuense TaxID=1069980 RepID=UPI001E3DCA24|nr:lipocalin family protein [Chryseobacterium gwangjuense]MCE3077271.1 lipocalin family protein [Chryseobacterium gwangjuense]